MQRSACVICVVVLLGGLCPMGCHVPPARPPQSLGELQTHQAGGSQEFTDRIILLHNLRRVLSGSLSARQRVESLRVVQRLNVSGAETQAALAQVLGDPKAPPAVRQAVLGVLIRKDYPDLAGHVRAALPHVDDAQLRSAILDWLADHPSRELLSDVVMLWAAEKPPAPEFEARYRRVVARMSAKSWQAALLDALNTEGFLARGSAVEVLTARVPPSRLRREIAALQPRTEAVRVMQYSSERFGYLPGTGRELLATVILYRVGGRRLDQAAKLAFEWQTRYGYRFNIRDFHLLSRLTADPLRRPLSRQELILTISRALASRRRPEARTARPGAGFDEQVESLSIADFWNLFLINEMLSRPRVREKLKIMAEQDRDDRETRWGGLIWYEQGQAEAKLYPPAKKRADDQYVPSRQMLYDGIDAMGFFVGHFGPLRSSAGIGPTERELALGKKRNLYGLILSNPGAGRLNATYFNPAGNVVDVGDFPLGP
jgi:hypothetical protein